MNYLQIYQKANKLTPDGIVGKQTVDVMMKDFGITSKIEFCHFIAQIKVESANFKAGRENLNYSAEALMKLFHKYFNSSEFAKYARHPEMIANKIYANRMGNKNEESGDGWKYRGVGALQLTGKTNIQLYLAYVGLPLDTDPDVLLQPEHYFRTAKFFFDSNNVWQFCKDKTTECVLKTSKKINIGNADSIRAPIGWQERLNLTEELFAILNA